LRVVGTLSREEIVYSLLSVGQVYGFGALATLHTNDAAGALPRLTNMGTDPFLSTSAIGCIVAQRLARRLYERCKDRLE